MTLRDRYITLHGRKPVLEALRSDQTIDLLHISEKATGDIIQQIKTEAKRKGIKVEFVSENRIAALSRSGQHQGVAADVRAPHMQALSNFLSQRNGREYSTAVLLLDGVQNPSNLGMILRTAAAADIDGVIVPEKGTASINPVAIKASSGVAFNAPILRVDTAVHAVSTLLEERFQILGFSSSGENLFYTDIPERVVLVLGNETTGISKDVMEYCHHKVAIPVQNQVESLNVAISAAIACYEIVRRRANSS